MAKVPTLVPLHHSDKLDIDIFISVPVFNVIIPTSFVCSNPVVINTIIYSVCAV